MIESLLFHGKSCYYEVTLTGPVINSGKRPDELFHIQS